NTPGIVALAVSPDGKLAITASSQGTLRFWEIPTGQPIGEPVQAEGLLTGITFRPDGKTFVLWTWSAVQLWDTAARKLAGPPVSPADKTILHAALSPDGRQVVTINSGHRAQLWQLDTGTPLGEPLDQYGTSAEVTAFAPSGRMVLVGYSNGTARL